MSMITELISDAKFMFKIRRRLMERQKGLNRLAPKKGDMAPDFILSDITGTNDVTLSDCRGIKPVALIFGSYT